MFRFERILRGQAEAKAASGGSNISRESASLPWADYHDEEMMLRFEEYLKGRERASDASRPPRPQQPRKRSDPESQSQQQLRKRSDPEAQQPRRKSDPESQSQQQLRKKSDPESQSSSSQQQPRKKSDPESQSQQQQQQSRKKSDPETKRRGSFFNMRGRLAKSPSSDQQRDEEETTTTTTTTTASATSGQEGAQEGDPANQKSKRKATKSFTVAARAGSKETTLPRDFFETQN